MSSNNAGIVLIIVLIAAIGGLVFYGNQDKANTAAPINQTETMETTEDTTMETSQTMTTPQVTKAVFTTNMGAFTIELYNDKTPMTVDNFAKLVTSGFYADTKFHRVIKDFMIQGGDPLSKDDSQKGMWGTGGPGYQFGDEFVEGLSNVKGTLSMANAGPGTNGSQFFINTADNTYLDGKHTVFGKVLEGMDVIEKIQAVETEEGDRPVEPVIIESIEVM